MSQVAAAPRPRAHNLAGALLRSLTIVAKFLLVYDLTRHLPLGEVGVFGLFTTTVTLAGSLLGLDFYTWAMREVVAAEAPRRRIVVWNQLALHAGVYAIVLPVLLLLAAAGLLPWRTTLFFCWIGAGSHLCVEATRLLIALKQPFAASLISFVAHGAWVIPVLGVGLAAPGWRSLDLVFASWGVGVSAGVMVAVRYLAAGRMLGRAVPPDLALIRRGLGTGLLFYSGTVAGLAPRFADRYFIHFQLGEAALGAYTFFASIAAVLHELVYAAFISVVQPRALASYERGELAEYRSELRLLLHGGLLWSIGLLPAFAGGIFVALHLVQKPELRDALPAYYVLLASAVVTSVSYRPHTELYALRRDRSLAGVAVLAAAAAVTLHPLLIPRFQLVGAAAATALAGAGLALGKWALARRLRDARRT